MFGSNRRKRRKALVAGWFSYPYHDATAGDLMAKDVACEWLAGLGFDFDVAYDEPFTGGVSLSKVRPRHYSHLVFVCGPVSSRHPLVQLLDQFSRCTTVGLDLSMLEPVSDWNPFNVLLERDSDRAHRCDIAIGAAVESVPVVGVVLVEPYPPEYPTRDRQERARETIRRTLDARPEALVEIDTRMDANTTGLRTPAELVSMIRKMDAVVTTRLHGLALSIANGVPVVAIDIVAGGAKISLQAKSLDWPVVITADLVTEEWISKSLDFCLSEEGRQLARQCAVRAREAVEAIRLEFEAALGQ